MVAVLQVLVSVIFFANKVLVRLGRNSSGWLAGVVAASLAFVYFYLIELYVYVALEAGLVVLMSYGFLFEGRAASSRVEQGIRIAIVATMAALAAVVFQGSMTVVEFASSAGMLGGTYLLTHGRVRTGWAVYGLAHVLAAYLGFAKDQHIFAAFQVASAAVSATGVFAKADSPT